ncbi:UNVERIFIED_CONTAM: hypothetical protein HDU68_011849 [Siphonaria sp. JEL0065]|nr:hypothetical protein HDU68_011849 [Siphonaria sp. JEL0065]
MVPNLDSLPESSQTAIPATSIHDQIQKSTVNKQQDQNANSVNTSSSIHAKPEPLSSPKKTAIAKFKSQYTFHHRKSSDHGSIKSSSTDGISESWKYSDLEGISESEDEESSAGHFSFMAKIPLASEKSTNHSLRHFSDQKTHAESVGNDHFTGTSPEIKRTLSEGTLSVGYPSQIQPLKRAYKFRDPRDWLLPGYNANSFPMTYLTPSDDTPLHRASSTPMFVPKQEETNLQETAEVLGVGRPEDVARLLNKEGISAWATVLAVGTGISASAGTPATADDVIEDNPDEVTKKDIDDVSISEMSEGTSKPGSTKSPRFSGMKKRRIVAGRKSGEKRASISSLQSKTADETLKREFILKLARALTQYGAPSHRLEYHLAEVARVLQVKGGESQLENRINTIC